ncbi:MAG TPA: TonB-dependent receptor [Steroidobacteraceae bacterium]
MSEMVRLLASLRAGRGVGIRVGLATVALGITGAFNATVSSAADVKAAAAAGDTDANIDEIVVTARKRSENLRDIPASITAISAATLEDAHVTQLDDLNSLVTNLNVVEAHDNTPDVTLRGVGAFGVVQGVGFYANDVQLFEGQIARPIDIERIEVLKGPQGTLFGGANVGGAIKYVTKDPTTTWQNEATAEFGSYDTRNYQAVFSGPLSDTVGIRASVYYDTHGGYIYDTYNKFDYGAANDHGARITLVAAPNEDNKIRVHVSADDFNTSSQNLMYTPPDAQTYYYSVNDYFVPSFNRHIISADVQFDHQINPDVALTSLSSYFTSYNRGNTDFNKKPIPLDFLQQNVDNRVYSEELRLASTGSSNLDWLVGAFFQGHKSALMSKDNNYNGDPLNPVLLSTDFDRDEKRQDQYALFGDLTYHHGDWQYEVGLRAEYYTSSLTAVNTNNLDPNTGLVLPIAPGRLTAHEFSPRVSVQYKFSPTLNVYGTIARGFTPGDEIEENFVVHPYRPELATNYEVGMKSLLEHSVQLNVALFYTTYKDRLYLFQALAGSIITDLTTNIGSSTNYGAEFDIAAPLPGGFKVSGGMGVLRATWGNITNYVDPVTGLAIPNLKGLTVPFAPAYTGNATLEWKHDFGGYEFGSRATGLFVGRSYWDPQDAAYQRAYNQMNLSASVEHSIWKVSASVTNLTQSEYNTIYWVSTDVGAPFNIARVNRPRWFLVDASVRF